MKNIDKEKTNWLKENEFQFKKEIGKLFLFEGKYNFNCLIHNESGEWLVEPGQGYCFTNSKSVFIQRYDERSDKMKYSMLDTDGNFIFKNKFTRWLPDDFNSTFLVEHNKKFSLIDKKGNFILKHKFSNAQPFYNDRAIVKVGRFYGMIDYEGDWVLEPIYTIMTNVSSRLDSSDYNVKVIVKTKDTEKQEITTEIKMAEF